jgi:hypothetical protein
MGSYLHLRMIAGIVLVALGVKKAIGHVVRDTGSPLGLRRGGRPQPEHKLHDALADRVKAPA